MRRTDDELLDGLTAIDHRLHQISTHLATIGTFRGQLDEIGANLDTLIGLLGSARPTLAGTAGQPPCCGATHHEPGRSSTRDD